MFTKFKPDPASPIRGVLFDMDGLVLDTEKLYTRFWVEAGRFYGFPMELEHGLALRSLGHRLGQERLRDFFGPDVDYAKLREKRIELMDAYIAKHGIAPKPGIFELLDWLQAHGIAAAITSSSTPENIRRHLTSQGLYHRFDQVCSGHQVPNGKPAPDIYLHGAAVLGLKPEECLALEDSPTGVLSAYRAGCHTVMIPDQDQPTKETEQLLYAKADTLSDIISLLETIR